MLTLTPGVAQPNYFQTGGINNPARSMQVTVNGAPNSNTVFRLDGVSATNQWIQGLQAYTPAIEAIETVNVVTNSFDAEQGMAGGASVNVQIKSGTNTLHGSAFEYFSHAGMRSRNYFLPGEPGQDEGQQERVRRHRRRADQARQGVLLRQHRKHGAAGDRRAVCERRPRARRRSSCRFRPQPSAPATSQVPAWSSTIRRPDNELARAACRSRSRTAASTSTADPRFDSCNFIPASRINQVSKNILSHLPLPTAARQRRTTTSPVPKYNSDFHKIDSKVTWNATSRLNMNGRFSYLPASELAGGAVWRRRGVNPLALGTMLDSNISSAAVSATNIVSSNFVIDGLFGFTRQHTYQQAPGEGHVLGSGGGHPERVSAAAAARLRHAAGRHRLAVVELVRERHPRQRQHRRRYSTTSTRSGSG